MESVVTACRVNFGGLQRQGHFPSRVILFSTEGRRKNLITLPRTLRGTVEWVELTNP